MPRDTIHMRIDPELKSAAKSEAAIDHIDLSAFVSQALSKYIEARRLDRKKAEVAADRDARARGGKVG